jgi:hypothetical protein
MNQILRRAPLAPSYGTAATFLIFVGLVATLIAAVVGIAFVLMITFPLSLFALLGIFQFFTWVWSGAVLAAPVTLVLLPGAAILGKNHPFALYFSLPIIGFAGGFLAMKTWAAIQRGAPNLVSDAKLLFPMGIPPVDEGEIFKWAGAVAGLIAGCVFSAAVREMAK